MMDYLTAQKAMTLSALAYVGECQGLDVITQKLEAELSKSHYATQGKAKLVWGPAKAADHAPSCNNLIYAAQDGHQTFVALRGTVFDSLYSWMEDVPTALVKPFDHPNGSLGLISKQFDDAIRRIVTFRDASGRTLETFLSSIAHTNHQITVTGHSQGAGLAPILHAWIEQRFPASTRRFSVSSYTFAAPTPGDADFANYISTLECYRFTNNLDIVRYGYNEMHKLGHPVPVDNTEARLLGDAAVAFWSYETGLSQDDFAPAGAETSLRSWSMPAGTAFSARIEAQHNFNTYLRLLRAPQTDVGVKSQLPDSL